MKRYMHNRILFPVLLLIFMFSSLTVVSAQEDIETSPGLLYGLGDRILVINGGLFVPLFFQTPTGSVNATNLSLGGLGSLELSTFLNNNLTLGGDVGGAIAVSPNNRTLLMLNLAGKVSYIFRNYPFEFPLSFGLGANITKINEETSLLPFIRPGASFYWNYNAEWAFGLNLNYWWIPEFYVGSPIPSGNQRFGNFLEVSLSALYHF